MKVNTRELLKRICIAGLIFLIEIGILLYPVGLLREERMDYLSGEGSYALAGEYDTESVCQVFRTVCSGTLKSVGIVLTSEETVGTGTVRVLISDRNNEILAEQEVEYTEDTLDRYQDVEVFLKVKRNEQYWLTVLVGVDENGIVPALKVCSDDYLLKESETLWASDAEVYNAQLLVSYTYTDAMDASKIWKAILLAFLTAVIASVPCQKYKKIQILAGIIAFLAFPVLVGRRLEALNMMQQFYLPISMKWNLLLMYLVEAIFILLLGSVRFGLIASQVLLTVTYTVTYFMYAFRGTPLRVNDLSAVETAAKVVGGYDLTPNSHLTFAWAILFLVLVIAWKAKISIRKWQIRLPIFAAGVILAVSAYHILVNTEFLEKRGFYNLSGFQYLMNYRFDGYLVATCIDISNNKVTKPEGYSEQKVAELLAENSGKTAQTEDLPNVIFIMNESFSDLRVLGNLELSEENLKNLYGLQENTNTIRGYTNVSVLGGGTANSEFEALTGCSMGLLPASGYAYQQYVKKPMETMVSIMKADGYLTYSIHPENRRNWNRQEIYQMFGFDQSFWQEDFVDAEEIHSGVSDRATYHKIEELYEQKEAEERIFVFDVTMQNHGGYERKAQEPEHTIHAENVESEEADIYLSLINESDAAFGELIDYFEKQQEKVIICMFGDHQPMFNDQGFYETLETQTGAKSEEETAFDQYKTPFVIWANYDIAGQDDVDISANYLGALLLETAGVPGNGYFQFLIKQMEEYPVITINGYKDSDGNTYQWTGEDTEFPEYRILQYYALFD